MGYDRDHLRQFEKNNPHLTHGSPWPETGPREIQNIRDLLIFTVGPEMGKARDSGLMRRRYVETTFGYDEAIVAWVLDCLTIKSLELLIELRKKEGFGDDG